MPCNLRSSGLMVAALTLLACAGERPSSLGVSDSRLAPCPSSPNCVSSEAPDSEHRIDAFRLAVTPGEAWRTAREVVADMPRTRIVTETADYLHAECESALIGFVDDLELHLRASEGIIDVRSASRLGRSDFGVNRDRVEALRSALVARGVIR